MVGKKLESTLEHSSGRKLIYLTTTDLTIRQYLHSSRDLCAAMNLARAIADRCLQFGIDQVAYFKDPSAIDSPKVSINLIIYTVFYISNGLYLLL